MEKSDLIQIGKRICDLRQRQGITQEKLAEKMDVSIQMVSNMERGNKEVRITNLIKLSEILNASTDYILTGKTVSEDKPLQEKLAFLGDDDKALINSLTNRLINNERKS